MTPVQTVEQEHLRSLLPALKSRLRRGIHIQVTHHGIVRIARLTLEDLEPVSHTKHLLRQLRHFMAFVGLISPP